MRRRALPGVGCSRSLTARTAAERRSNDLDLANKTDDHASDLQFLVELRGFEPLTPSMRTRLLQVHRPKLQKRWSAAPLQHNWERLGQGHPEEDLPTPPS